MNDEPADSAFRERSIYIPFDRLHSVFERDQRGVFLPYEEFMQLWTAAREAPREAAEKHPAEYLISAIEGNIRVGEEVVSATARLRIEVFKEGWSRIPLRLGGSALKSATVDGEPARLLPQPNGETALLLRKDDSGPRQYNLTLEFAKAFSSSPGRNTVTFSAPRAPVSQWDVTIPAPGVDVDIEPAIAVTRKPDEQDAKQTHVLAFVGAAPQITLSWTPKAEGARGLETLASVKTDTRVSVEEGATRIRAELEYSISRAALNQVQVDIPLGYRVINVHDANVREWTIAETDGRQQVTAELFEPADDKQKLVIELEAFGDQERFDVPQVSARGVHRQQGTVVVDVADNLRAETVERRGLLQLDERELPEHLRADNIGTRWDFAYSYAGLPYALALRVEKIQPRIVAETLVKAHLQPEFVELNASMILDVQRAGVFQFMVRIPSGYEVRSVHGTRVRKGVSPAAVDSHHATEDGRLEINLSRQAKGVTGLGIRLRRTLSESALLTPTGESAALDIPLPRFESPFLAAETGHLALFSPESLRLNARTTEGLRAVPRDDVSSAGWPLQSKADKDPLALAFAYAEQPVTFVLDAERRLPHVSVRQLQHLRVEPGVVRHEIGLHYSIRYSGVPSLLVALPRDRAGDIRLVSEGLRHSVVEDTSSLSDLPEDVVVWKVVADTEMLGERTVQFRWEEKVDSLTDGAEIDLPRIQPLQADRSWGQIVLSKDDFIDIKPVPPHEGLRSIDPQYDLAGGTRIANAARAFEFHESWSLRVKARRYTARDVKATSIERALVRGVLTRSGVTSVQALFRMRSVRQRLKIHLPEGVSFDTRPVRLNGRPVALEDGGNGAFHIPLAGQDPTQSFLLELRYTLANGGKSLQCPEFPNEPAIQKVYMSAYYPAEQSYLGYTGAWHDEMVWALHGVSALPRPVKSSDWLLDWVSEGVSTGSNDSIGEFAADGQRVLYSTLRPAAGEEGALRLYTTRRVWLNAAILIVGIGIGLALLPARASTRILVVGAIIVALLVLDVFCQSLAVALVTNASVSGAAIVLVLWTMKYLLVDRPAEIRRKREMSPPPPPEPEPEPKSEPEPKTEPEPEPKAETTNAAHDEPPPKSDEE
ncbi:MAG: hypothetical protein ACOCWJ_01810 [Verrucomicrobiota bacterium]